MRKKEAREDKDVEETGRVGKERRSEEWSTRKVKETKEERGGRRGPGLPTEE